MQATSNRRSISRKRVVLSRREICRCCLTNVTAKTLPPQGLFIPRTITTSCYDSSSRSASNLSPEHIASCRLKIERVPLSEEMQTCGREFLESVSIELAPAERDVVRSSLLAARVQRRDHRVKQVKNQYSEILKGRNGQSDLLAAESANWQ